MGVHAPQAVRRRLHLTGCIQGVGFRPYVYRLARSLGLAGFVANSSSGVIIEVEGEPQAVEAFERRLPRELPPLARLTGVRSAGLPPRGEDRFTIRPSAHDSPPRAHVPPDVATCADCLAELFDPADRRHRYPFTNCTNCGPRYTIIRAIPYDRPATTMADFRMCPRCRAEYEEPADRRFHAQPNACPACGPALRLLTPGGLPLAGDPIRRAAQLLRAGRIVAIKGLGGYHLACRADDDRAVRRLRRRKLREAKPFAVMVASLAEASRICRLSEADEALLTSPEAPIVLAPKRPGHGLAPSVAPGCACFGIFLPYTPLHHLLLAEHPYPLVMTSANLSGEPLVFRETDALAHLAGVADAFLTHNRPIYRPVDDSVVFTFRGECVPLRRARGYAPRPIPTPTSDGPPILAVGGDLKNAVCLWSEGQAILSEHLGDLSHPAAFRHFAEAIGRLARLFDFRPHLVACDLHPRYFATMHARGLGLPVVAVQHHHAHIAAVMAEHGIREPVVGIACDGVGLGSDGTAWGCEILRCEPARFERLGHLAPFPLLGGDAAAAQTWRPALALLHAAFGEEAPRVARELLPWVPPVHLRSGFEQIGAGVNTPLTSSLGRVFDAVAALLGLCERNRHEAQAAMALEAAAGDQPAEPLPYTLERTAGGLRLSLLPAIAALARERQRGAAQHLLAAQFHETVASALADAAERAAAATHLHTVALSGGCFANRRLLAGLVRRLEERGLRVIWHRLVPCGDGGIALGQAYVAAARWQEKR